VEALIDGWERAHGLSVTVEAFDEMALGVGTGASAMACVRVRSNDVARVGVALAPDTTAASLQAVSTAVAQLESSRSG
jgi:2-isopropylmalate synthase